MIALEAAALDTYYGKSHILHGVSLTLGDGQIATLLGRNGAGKTTTMRSLLGLTPARSGTVRVLGQDCTAWPPYRIAALGVGYVPEARRVFANLTVEENLRVPLRRSGSWTTDAVYELFPRHAERRSHRGRQLSGGEQQMLAIGRALVLNPRILLLDEPSQGLAPLIVQEVLQVVARLRAQGLSILLVEQNVRAAIQIADVAYVLDDGRIVYQGPTAALAADEDRLRTLAGAAVDAWSPTPVSAVAEPRRLSG